MIMAKLILHLPLLCLFLLFSNSGGILKFTHGQTTVNEPATWCAAKPSTPKAQLQLNINFACDNLMNCKIIQYGGACFEPNQLINHASVVMNLYYQKVGRHYWDCDFNKTGLITMTDPSYCDCKYAYGG